ncbi:hypothetical protein MLD52_13275 [Puniceicoccaceae bacterium K14]|nr:hypothetical protein [Puniceicoccaceae bacterium K14]
MIPSLPTDSILTNQRPVSSNNSRKSFLVGITAAIAAVVALPRFLLKGKPKQVAVQAPTAKFALKQDPKVVSRKDSRFV